MHYRHKKKEREKENLEKVFYVNVQMKKGLN